MSNKTFEQTILDDGDLRPFDPNVENPLDHFISENYAAYQRIKAADDQKKIQEQQAQEQAYLDAFQTALETDLGETLAQALGLAYHIVKNGRTDRYTLSATFQDNGSHFEIIKRDSIYEVVSVVQGYRPDYNVSCKGEEIQAIIAIGIGEMREKRAEEQRVREERQRQQFIQDEQTRQSQQAKATQRATEFTAETAEHKRLTAVIEAARQDLIDSSFRWSAGVTLTYYELSWCAGAVYDGDNEGLITDNDKAWTLMDTLSSDGFIDVYSAYGVKRTIKLDMNAHKPIWERFSASSVEDLPIRLREQLWLRVPGIGTTYVAEAQDRYFCADSNHNYSDTIGEYALPVKWLREALL